jgi:hypothetical protein
MNQPVQIDTSIGIVSGVLRRADRSRHGEIECLLFETEDSTLLIKVWTAIRKSSAVLRHLDSEASTLASNATLSHSLHSADKKPLTPKTVADNIIKEAEIDRAKKTVKLQC